MPSTNRKRLTIEAGASSLLHPEVKHLPGWIHAGLVTVGDETWPMICNTKTGAYAAYTGGSIRSLDQRKVLAALGQFANAKKLEGGARKSVYLDGITLDRLSKLGDGNISEGIRRAAEIASQ
jgi:hypothetical protein